jgi:nucleoside-diphosphate-sugar epimerase
MLNSSKKTILVTGGAGYVGSILLKRLLDNGYRVVCVDKLHVGGESLLGLWHHPDFKFCKCDINDKDSLIAIMKQEKYFAVVHLAAIVGDPACKNDPDLATLTNWTSSKYLLELSQELGVERFIFASTCSNYGKMDSTEGYVKEDSPLAPVSLYAELKVKFERLIFEGLRRTSGFCPTCLRFATVYGISPRMRFDLTVNEFTKELSLGKELIVYGEKFWRPYCHVADFSRAIISVFEADKDKVAYNVFNVGDTKENYTKKMILDELLKHFPHARIRRVETKEDPRDYRVNFDKIKSQLGFKISKTVPDGIDEIKKVLQWGVIQNPEEQRYYNILHQG